MKNNRKKIVTLILTAIMALVMSTAVFAAAAKKITITGSLTSMTVGQTKELDSKITPGNAKIKDKNIVWTSSNPKVIKVLDKTGDDTDIKALKAGTATITVTIKGTKLKATRKITVKKSAVVSVSSYEKKISTYQTNLKTVYNSMKKASVKKTYKARRQQAATYDAKLEKIDRQLDDLEDTIKSLYRSGKITASQYRSLNRKLDNVDDYASKIEDYLEDKFGDFDD